MRHRGGRRERGQAFPFSKENHSLQGKGFLLGSSHNSVATNLTQDKGNRWLRYSREEMVEKTVLDLELQDFSKENKSPLPLPTTSQFKEDCELEECS
jgi:hypothetical protein